MTAIKKSSKVSQLGRILYEVTESGRCRQISTLTRASAFLPYIYPNNAFYSWFYLEPLVQSGKPSAANLNGSPFAAANIEDEIQI